MSWLGEDPINAELIYETAEENCKKFDWKDLTKEEENNKKNWPEKKECERNIKRRQKRKKFEKS